MSARAVSAAGRRSGPLLYAKTMPPRGPNGGLCSVPLQRNPPVERNDVRLQVSFFFYVSHDLFAFYRQGLTLRMHVWVTFEYSLTSDVAKVSM